MTFIVGILLLSGIALGCLSIAKSIRESMATVATLLSIMATITEKLESGLFNNEETDH